MSTFLSYSLRESDIDSLQATFFFVIVVCGLTASQAAGRGKNNHAPDVSFSFFSLCRAPALHGEWWCAAADESAGGPLERRRRCSGRSRKGKGAPCFLPVTKYHDNRQKFMIRGVKLAGQGGVRVLECQPPLDWFHSAQLSARGVENIYNTRANGGHGEGNREVEKA